MRDLVPSLSGKRMIPRGKPADSDEDVFIPLEDTVAKIKQLINRKDRHHIKFIRAPVAAGKSTLVKYLIDQHSEHFVMVEIATNEKQWYRNIIAASGRQDLGSDQVSDALKEIQQKGKTIVIDEAHCLFAHPNLLTLITKTLEQWKNPPRILLFSAAGTGFNATTNSLVVTPSEISNKYMWYPPVPERVGLSQILQDADIIMDEDSVTFFFKLCCGHRGIFMHAMDWVQARQQGSKEKWDVVRSISEVRSTFGGRKNREIRAWKQGLLQHFTQSRAVRVNGKFSDVNLIPKEFAEVLFGGPKL